MAALRLVCIGINLAGSTLTANLQQKVLQSPVTSSAAALEFRPGVLAVADSKPSEANWKLISEKLPAASLLSPCFSAMFELLEPVCGSFLLYALGKIERTVDVQR